MIEREGRNGRERGKEGRREEGKKGRREEGKKGRREGEKGERKPVRVFEQQLKKYPSEKYWPGNVEIPYQKKV